MTDQPTGSQITTALATLQQNLPDVERKQTGQVGPRPYKYADLAAINKALLPELGKLGLVFTSTTQVRDDGKTVLHYELRHTSGETIGGDFPITSTGTPQQIGAAITYGRRYAIQAVTGLATEEDTDGPADQYETTKPVKRSKGKPAEPDQWATAPTGPDERSAQKLTDRQRTAIQAGFTELGLGGEPRRDERLAALNKILDRPASGPLITSTNDLDRRQAADVLDAIDRKKQYLRENPNQDTLTDNPGFAGDDPA